MVVENGKNQIKEFLKGMDKNMDIAFICDKKYLIPTKVAINSIVHNMDEADHICIYIIGVGLSPVDFSWITQLQSEQVYIKPIFPGEYFTQMTIRHLYVSKAALYKFLLPELIGVDKILYLDSDVLVLNSLKELYEKELGDMYAAVVKDMGAELEDKYHKKIRVSYYFNSGVMLLNLKELRKNRIYQKLIDKRQSDLSSTFMDQDTFNKVFDNKIILLSPKYNYMLTNIEDYNYSPEDIAAFYNLDVEEIKKIMVNPVVLHLTNKKKPWNNSDASHQDIWYQYAFKHDFPQIIQDIVYPWKKEIEQQRISMEFKLAQQRENTNFYKYNRMFFKNEIQLTGVMKDIWKSRKEIIDYLGRWENECEIVIYGAGRMGWATFKILWFSNYINRITGFAVSNMGENIEELYGKKIFNWADYENRNAVILIAVRDISKEEIEQKILNRGFKNILKISEFLI